MKFRRNQAIISAIIALTILIPISQLFIFQSDPQWQVTNDTTGLIIDMSGQCKKPFTYVGTDTRTYLLNHYDIRGRPVEKKYSPVQLNWARVVMIETALNRCKDTEWVVYSDTDAYISSRNELASKLKTISTRKHIVYHRGSWFVNAGFTAWRNTNESRAFLKKWVSNYKQTTYFFAEQQAMKDTLEKNMAIGDEHYNGFLGWHIKGVVSGDARFKTAIATTARRGCYYETTMQTGAVLFVIAIASLILGVKLRWEVFGKESPKLEAVAAVLFGRKLLAIMLTFVVIVLFIMRDPGYDLYSGVTMSVPNFSHLMPRGRRMVFDHEETGRYYVCAGFWCVNGKGWYFWFWDSLSRIKPIVLTMFVVTDVLDKSFYAAGVTACVMAWLGCIVLTIAPRLRKIMGSERHAKLGFAKLPLRQ